MRRGILRVLCVVLFLGVTAAAADASPITVSAGQTVIFNFDFAAEGVVPPPLYPVMEFFANVDLSTDDASDNGTLKVFTDLNGGGIVAASATGSGVDLSTSTNNLGLTDGIFSATLTMTAGSITLDPYAFGADANLTPLTPHVSALQPVPEPATLTLLGGGLAATALRRRFRRG